MSEQREETPTSRSAVSKERPTTLYEREIQNMLDAVELIERKADDLDEGFTGRDVLNLNKIVMNDPLNPHKYGVLRRTPAKIGYNIKGEYRTRIPNDPSELPDLFQSYSEEIFERSSRIDHSTDIGEVLETACWVHTELVRFHPFNDGNGRTARLLVDLIFKRANLPYITDWGAENDEYRDIVDRTFRENEPALFKDLVARKLIDRATELSETPGLSTSMASIVHGARSYLEGLNINVSETL